LREDAEYVGVIRHAQEQEGLSLSALSVLLTATDKHQSTMQVPSGTVGSVHTPCGPCMGLAALGWTLMDEHRGPFERHGLAFFLPSTTSDSLTQVIVNGVDNF
jgi:hypothetical protein